MEANLANSSIFVSGQHVGQDCIQGLGLRLNLVTFNTALACGSNGDRDVNGSTGHQKLQEEVIGTAVPLFSELRDFVRHVVQMRLAGST